MGLLDEAIRQHLDLKLRHGADLDEVVRLEREALGAAVENDAPQTDGYVSLDVAPAVKEPVDQWTVEPPQAPAPQQHADPQPAPIVEPHAQQWFETPVPAPAPVVPPVSEQPVGSPQAPAAPAAPSASAPEQPSASEQAPAAPAAPRAQASTQPSASEQAPAAPAAPRAQASMQPPIGEQVAGASPEPPVAMSPTPPIAPLPPVAPRQAPPSDWWDEAARSELHQLPATRPDAAPAGYTDPPELVARRATGHPSAPAVPATPGADDVLEGTPEFLQATPEHDLLWFEQKPPRDFDFDK